MNRLLTAMILVLASTMPAFAQDWKTKYSNADAVYTKLACEVVIKWENGKLVSTSNYSESLVYLTGNAVKMMSKGHIYHSSFNELKSWDAYTQLPDEKKKLKTSNTSTASSRQDYIFYDDVKSTTFDYTGGIVGASRHLEYQLLNKNIHLLSPYYFERYFPVAENQLSITFPSNVKLKYIAKGLNASKIQVTESSKKDRITYTFKINDLESSRAYDDAPDNSWYATHLIYYVEKTSESGEWKNFLSEPADLFRLNYEFIRNINKTTSTELKNLTDSITSGSRSPHEKAGKIYKWVQSHIKYVAFEEGMEGFIPREASLVCSRRFGDCKDMASILTSMLQHAGLDAYFTWIGTRDIPYDYTEVPLPIVDNHMICTVKIGEEYIFLDATDEGCIYGTPPYSIQGKQSMLAISDKEFKIIRVPVIPKEKNLYTDSTFMQLTDQGIQGSIKVTMRGYFASNLYSALSFRNKEEREDYFKGRFGRGSNKIRFTNWEYAQNADHSEMTVTANFELPDYSKKLGSDWYLNLNLFKWYEHQEIDYPKRKMPIEFSFLNRSSFATVLTIPEGYQLSYLPKSSTYKNDVWGFVMNYMASGNKVSLTQEFDTDQLMLYPESFEKWNKVLEHLFPNYKQTISLSKK